MALDPIRVLTVADSTVLRAGLRAMLASDAGISLVAEAGSAAQAVAMAREAHPDVAVVDVRNSGQIDLRTCEEFHRQGSDCQVLMLVMPTDEESILDLLLDGAAGYLGEDVTAEELCDAVRIVRRGGAPVDPQIAAVIARRMRLRASSGLTPASPLSGDDMEILGRIVRGETNHEIGRCLHLPDQVVKHRVSDILKKIDAKNRVAAAAWWARRKSTDTALRH